MNTWKYNQVIETLTKNKTYTITKQNSQLNYALSQQLLKDVYTSSYNEDWFQYFLIIKKYFASLFHFEGESEVVKYQHFLLGYLWEFGEIVVSKIDNQLKLFHIIRKETNGIYVKKVDVVEISQGGFENWKVRKVLTLINGVNCIYLNWNIDRLPSIFYWNKYLHEIIQLKDIFLMSTVWDSKKFLRVVNNNNEKVEQQELESISNPYLPFITLVNPTANSVLSGSSSSMNFMSNSFRSFDLGQSKSSIAFDNLERYQNYVFNMLGVQVPIEQKKERKTFVESSTDVYNTSNLEDMTLRFLESFCDEWNKLYNEQISINKNLDLVNPIMSDEANTQKMKDEVKGYE